MTDREREAEEVALTGYIALCATAHAEPPGNPDFRSGFRAGVAFARSEAEDAQSEVERGFSLVERGFSLCGACGVVTAHAEWEGFNADDGGNKIPAGPLDEPYWLRCPFCCVDHTDDDSDPGVWGGTKREMESERARLIRDGEAGDWQDYDDPENEIEAETPYVGAPRYDGRWTICRDCSEAWPTDEDAERSCGCESREHYFTAVETREQELLRALKQIDGEVPSEEHWRWVGDSMWANVGRSAARIVRAALAATSEDPDA